MKAYAKALVGGAVTGLGALSTALPGGVNSQEWITIAVATLAALGIVYRVPNTPSK